MSVEASFGATATGSAFELGKSAAVAEPSRAARRPRTRSERIGIAAIVSIPLLGLLLCIAGTRTNALLPQSIQPAPASMAGPLRYVGFTLQTGEVIAAVVLMLFGYLVAIRYAHAVSARTVICAVALLNVIVLLGPPFFSTDVFSYQAYARMFAIYHTNPYVHGPWAIELDPIHWYIGAEWYNTPSVYGPLFTFLSGGLASTSVSFSEFAFKLIAAVSSGGTMYLIWRSAQQRGLSPVRGIALFGLNPLVVLYGVGGGHNDLLMVLLTTWGIYALLTRHERGAGALVASGIAIKLTGAVVLPFALMAGTPLGAGRRRRAFLLGAASVTIVIAAASFACFGVGILHLPHTLLSVQKQGAWQSVPGFLFWITGIPVSGVVRAVFDLGLGAALLWLIHRVWSGRMDWIDGAAWATLAVLVTAWSMLPWYVCWLMPLVALGTSRRLWRAAMLMTVAGGAMMVIDCFPHGVNL